MLVEERKFAKNHSQIIAKSFFSCFFSFFFFVECEKVLLLMMMQLKHHLAHLSQFTDRMFGDLLRNVFRGKQFNHFMQNLLAEKL
jgi:hypothetical protein